MVEEFGYLADDNNGHGYNDDEEFYITDLFQSNMNKVNILFEVIDGQESCNIDRRNITPSCNDEGQNVDEILSDIEQNVLIISNQNTMPNYYQFMSSSGKLICLSTRFRN